jgi:hypothetical protein
MGAQTYAAAGRPAGLPGAAADLRSEVFAAGTQVGRLAASGWAGVRHPATLGWRAVPLAIWLVGIIGDAVTTVAMMRSGSFEEANGVASAGMGVLGPAGYTAAASGLCLLFAVVGAGRPRGRYAVTLAASLAVLGLAKCYVAGSNALLWAAG